MADASATTKLSDRELARHALERVCANADPAAASGVYRRAFVGHVNARDYRGHDGIRASLALYQLVFRDGDLRNRGEDQVAEGDRVVSRWVAEGHNRGRPLRQEADDAPRLHARRRPLHRGRRQRGHPQNPAWVHNLRAHPDTEIQVGRRRIGVHAREADAEERPKLWPKALAYNSHWRRYERRAERTIPLLVLEPRTD